MFYKDNWVTWDCNGSMFKKSPLDIVEYKFHKTIHLNQVSDYKTELFKNASKVYELHNQPLDLLLSGGIDSEIILRTNLDLGIPIKPYIFKYENNYNIREYTMAVKVCEQLNVTPTIIDFNLEKFIENDAYDMWTKCYSHSSGRLPHLKMTEYLDNIPVFGNGDPYWCKENDDWYFEFDDSAHMWTMYFLNIGRTALSDWYEYSPEVIFGNMKSPIITDLINDRIPGKLGSNSSKIPHHRNIWPDIFDRQKLVGFEGIDMAPGNKPEFMHEFDRTYCKDIKPVRLLFTKEEITDALCYV